MYIYIYIYHYRVYYSTCLYIPNNTSTSLHRLGHKKPTIAPTPIASQAMAGPAIQSPTVDLAPHQRQPRSAEPDASLQLQVMFFESLFNTVNTIFIVLKPQHTSLASL